MTTCFACNVSAYIGVMAGEAGLPSLDPSPRGEGDHELSHELTTGGDADTDETFGYIYSGFEAVGLVTHAFETYKQFLEKHDGHRLFNYFQEHDLPEELRGREVKVERYVEPKSDEGYVKRRFMFDCRQCGDSRGSDDSDWVRGFEPRKLDVEALTRFEKVAVDAVEMNVHEEHPFNFVFFDLERWLETHKEHDVWLSLVE